MTHKTPLADPAVTPELVKDHGLTPEEFERIKEILGREPNFTELGIFSVMWSEHCSYKNSKKELKKFPTTGTNILVKAGEENAGVVDIGDGWAVAFKMESHNHPSAIEPFQGAATGVGGIIRDIFTMGARPEFCLNSLRFGPITNKKSQIANHKSPITTNRRLFTGVVSGIAHYGNCVGIPTIGGEIYFDESFEGNPLVNVFCLGVLRHEQLARGTAEGAGNPVFYVGAETGRDGLAGAFSMGLRQGIYCTGCCWLLMALLFVFGVMNLVWIGALTVFVLVEKLLRTPRWFVNATGAVLLLWAAVITYQASNSLA